MRKEALYVKVGGKTIHELLCMNVSALLDFLKNIDLTEYERNIASKAIEEIVSRLEYIQDVGLGYLTLNRTSNTFLKKKAMNFLRQIYLTKARIVFGLLKGNKLLFLLHRQDF